MAEAVRAGLLSFAFVESWPFEPSTSRGPQTHLELAEEAGLWFVCLQRLVEAFGFPRPEPAADRDARCRSHGRVPPAAGAHLDRAPDRAHRASPGGRGRLVPRDPAHGDVL